jgi:hypothetical protein
MTDQAKVIDAINACKALFLAEIQELDCNGLRVVVAENSRWDRRSRWKSPE